MVAKCGEIIASIYGSQGILQVLSVSEDKREEIILGLIFIEVSWRCLERLLKSSRQIKCT